MQSSGEETIETSPTGLPQAPKNDRNPPYQHHIPQFGISGGVYSVFQYTTPKAGL